VLQSREITIIPTTRSRVLHLRIIFNNLDPRALYINNTISSRLLPLSRSTLIHTLHLTVSRSTLKALQVLVDSIPRNFHTTVHTRVRIVHQAHQAHTHLQKPQISWRQHRCRDRTLPYTILHNQTLQLLLHLLQHTTNVTCMVRQLRSYNRIPKCITQTPSNNILQCLLKVLPHMRPTLNSSNIINR
jgi:hypothetical protein